jgi:hypothetical protein
MDLVHVDQQEQTMSETVLKTKEPEHEGKVVSIAGNKFTTLSGNGRRHHFTVAKDAHVTCDGHASKAADLKVGTQVRVTTHKEDKSIATAIDSGKHIPAPIPKV